MAKLTRVTSKIFGNEADPNISGDPEISQFGSALAQTFIGTDDVATIQALPAWDKGWVEAVTAKQQFPALSEMTGVMKVLSYQTAYNQQMGIPEWDDGTEYYINSFVQVEGKIYKSKEDNNINNNPTESDKWEEFSSGGGAGLPIGTIYPVACSSAYVPNGALSCDGTQYTKSQFSTLWTNYLIGDLLNTCTYEEYQQDITTYGECDKFAIDTENETFKVPTINDNKDLKYFVQVANGSINEEDMDWSAWASSLQGKANIDLNNLSDTGKKVIDGQWIFSSLNITNVTSIGSYEYSLSSYLPDDGYNYEVMIKFGGYRDASSGYAYIDMGNSQQSVLCHCAVSSNARGSYGYSMIPVLADRKMVLSIINNNFTSILCEAVAYRRIGTNQ